MSVTNENVKKIAHLARIRVDDSQISEVRDNLNKILDFVDQLEEVDCEGVDAAVDQYATTLRERRDVCLACDLTVMNNAPQKENNMFVVPKVVE
ncbi:MAG: Asp-tRNA(Asn)/Glu-tRNA(Gln) amidotransferase subunit GatC [Holosporaceae bacterium]|jgi:aspartyl-tRNA(Asn)/glutamyl-tRNA(Gln) amidotransferase subunit C|nr:Asp-tRNA(Asn)/Glu-tRNA(Gln) amidotransferase subunit GatC [Holosporaceae bacterium]